MFDKNETNRIVDLIRNEEFNPILFETNVIPTLNESHNKYIIGKALFFRAQEFLQGYKNLSIESTQAHNNANHIEYMNGNYGNKNTPWEIGFYQKKGSELSAMAVACHEKAVNCLRIANDLGYTEAALYATQNKINLDPKAQAAKANPCLVM